MAHPPSSARFSPGDLITHRLFGYRGVVGDVDADFQLSDEWYENVARSRPPRDVKNTQILNAGYHDTETMFFRMLVSMIKRTMLFRMLVTMIKKHIYKKISLP